MTDVDIGTVNTTATDLSGGNINDTYFVFNNIQLVIDINFQCEAIVLGRDRTGVTESAGFLDCVKGTEITFGAGKTLLTISPTQHLWIYADSAVRDNGANPTEPNDITIFQRQNQSEFLRIFYVKGTITWTLKYYRLVAPEPIIIEYPSSAVPDNKRNVWFDPMTFGEFAGASKTPRTPNIGLIPRRGFTSRPVHRGFTPRQLQYTLKIDEEDAGAFKKLEELLEAGSTQEYFIVTDREVLIDYIFSGIGGISRTWEKDTSLLNVSLTFQEKIL